MRLGSHSDTWQWFDSEQFHGKTIISDLTIDRKAGVYIAEIRRYSDNDF
jgi:hypothetical protein